MHSLLAFAVAAAAVTLFVASVESAEVRWCCAGDEEMSKCTAMKDAVKGEATTSDNSITCIKAAHRDDCVEKVVNKGADLMSMDGGEMYPNVEKLYPVTAEIYDPNKPGLNGAAYYAVAFVKKNSTLKLSDLKDKKTCHTGAGRSAGWKIPMGYLFSKKYIGWTDNCDQYYSAAKYFKESCVPGVKTKVQDASKVENLCALCSGAGDQKCSSSSAEPYSGYEGAFKCMYYGAGEVAFAKQSTFDDITDVSVGVADDYRLLCKDGTMKAISEYKDCNLGKNPAHAVMTSNMDKANDYATWLLKIDAAFGVGKGKSFELYNSSTSTYMGSNLLFKDSTKKLLDISNKTTSEYLGDGYIQSVKGLKDCVAKSSASAFYFNCFLVSLALVVSRFLQ